MVGGDLLVVWGVSGAVILKEGSGALSVSTNVARETFTASRKGGGHLRALWLGGGQALVGLSVDSRLDLLCNAEVSGVCWDAVVDSCCSSVHVGVFPFNVVTGVFSVGGAVVSLWLSDNGGGRLLLSLRP